MEIRSMTLQSLLHFVLRRRAWIMSPRKMERAALPWMVVRKVLLLRIRLPPVQSLISAPPFTSPRQA